MELLLAFRCPLPTPFPVPPITGVQLQASRRYRETYWPEPLFVDPYACCFVHPKIQTDLKKRRSHYYLATKFIDDRLFRTVNHIAGLKQVVLLTDGMDTRPHRLNWPSSTIIFDISPEQVFKKGAEKLEVLLLFDQFIWLCNEQLLGRVACSFEFHEGLTSTVLWIQWHVVGAKILRGCSFIHIPMESSTVKQILCKKGFSSSHPSIWAIQGLPLMTFSSFEEVLSVISGLTTNSSLFLGELPAWLAKTEVGIKSTTTKWVEKEFTSNGFLVDVINYNDIASSLGKEIESKDYKNIVFVAEQLRFSEDQMKTWRTELQRVKRTADEEGFEEL
ncbi:hypothetical protein SLE2022_243320 [Rubroshorea leprosula]